MQRTPRRSFSNILRQKFKSTGKKIVIKGRNKIETDIVEFTNTTTTTPSGKMGVTAMIKAFNVKHNV